VCTQLLAFKQSCQWSQRSLHEVHHIRQDRDIFLCESREVFFHPQGGSHGNPTTSSSIRYPQTM